MNLNDDERLIIKNKINEMKYEITNNIVDINNIIIIKNKIELLEEILLFTPDYYMIKID